GSRTTFGIFTVSTARKHVEENIPKLDKKNFLCWSMKMNAHLCHRGLIKYVLETPNPLPGAAAKAVAKKHSKTVDILMNYMMEMVFKVMLTKITVCKIGVPVWNFSSGKKELGGEIDNYN
ncbi:hypothetical protein VP01_8108g1, partial [Puccinia sorghi]